MIMLNCADKDDVCDDDDDADSLKKIDAHDDDDDKDC